MKLLNVFNWLRSGRKNTLTSNAQLKEEFIEILTKENPEAGDPFSHDEAEAVAESFIAEAEKTLKIGAGELYKAYTHK